MNLEIFIDYCDPDFFSFFFLFKKNKNKTIFEQHLSVSTKTVLSALNCRICVVCPHVPRCQLRTLLVLLSALISESQ